MAKYTQLNVNQVQAITNQYGFKFIDCEPISGGAGNTSFLLYTSEMKVVLTVFEIGWDRVTTLVRLLHQLAEYEFPTTRVLNMPEGEDITTMVGKPVVLKPYIPGGVTRNYTENMLAQVGAAMALLHTIPAPRYLPDQHPYGLQTFPGILGRNIDPRYEAWLSKKQIKFQECINPGLPRCLIHGDLFWDNVIFEGDELKGIIDFEEACNYFRVFDLGMAFVGLCTGGTGINLCWAKALLSGYQDGIQLEMQEKADLQFFVEYAATATATWQYWKYNIDTPIPEKAGSHWQMANIADSAAAIPGTEFDGVFLR